MALDGLIPETCSTSFSHPSGHALNSAAVYLYLYFQLPQNLNPRIKKVILTIVIALFLTLGYSRFYVGVHTLDNILFGWMIGIWAALTYHFAIEPKLMEAMRMNLA